MISRNHRAAAIRRLAFGVILAGALAAGRPAASRPPAGVPSFDGPPEIRVGLLVDVAEVELGSFGGGFEIVAEGKETKRFETGSSVRVLPADGGLELWSLRGRRLAGYGDEIELRTREKRGYLMVNGRTYRGSLTVLAGVPGALTVVNTLPIGAYLRGVVGREIGFVGEEELAAIEVQAITSRTYALAQMVRHEERAFHVYADIRDQVYGGRKEESSWVDQAVRRTSGRVLVDSLGLARAYYHSTCGGHTSDIRKVWPQKDPRGYLGGIRDAAGEGRSYCSWSKYFRWVESWSARELGEILRRTLPDELGLPPGTDVGYLRDLELGHRSDSGRVLELRIRTTGGEYTVRGDRIRWVLRPARRPREILRSTMFKMETARDASGRLVSIRVRGGGWGHGVGLCQVGAITLSRLGVSPERILGFYFPGTTLRKVY